MRSAKIELTCGLCGNKFECELRQHKYRLKQNPNTKFYCSPTCRRQAAKAGKFVKCYTCDAEVYKYEHELNGSKSGFVFCSRSCSAITNNKFVKRQCNTTKKDAACKFCGVVLEIHAHACPDNITCDSCKAKQVPRTDARARRAAKTHPCINCPTIISGTCKYCADCLKQRQIQYGQKSAAQQWQIKRSKNEMYFAELCKQVFIDVLENQPMFNGWDADVILPEYKLAVLWNGNWHHKQISKKQSLKQVQARDKIKIDQIRIAGYIPYVINDYGSHNTKFVECKFKEMLDGYHIVTNKFC